MSTTACKEFTRAARCAERAVTGSTRCLGEQALVFNTEKHRVVHNMMAAEEGRVKLDLLQQSFFVGER